MRTLFRPKKSGELTLPPNFAEHLLDQEMLLEDSPSKASVLQLVDLYSVIPIQKAIEFYEDKNDLKYIYYHQRLQKMLQCPKVAPLLGGPLLKPKKPPSLQNNSELIVSSHEQSSSSSGHLMAQNLSSQERNLHAKIQARRGRYAAIVKKKQKLNIQEFQRELESVIEEFASRKYKEQSDIKEQYSKLKEKIRRDENGDVEKRLGDVDSMIQRDILKSTDKLEKERLEAIQVLKNKVNK